MNVTKFTDIITKDPLTRSSTTRFRQVGGTLWLKADITSAEKQRYIPILSYCDTFIVDWGSVSHAVCSSRSHNLIHDLKSSAKRAWLTKLAGPKGMEYPFPAICVTSKFANAQLAVEKPSAAAIKSLLRGKHPEDGTSRYEWSRASYWDSCGTVRKEMNTKLEQLQETDGTAEYLKWRDSLVADSYRDSFTKPLTEAVRSLAYGAVKKENMLKSMTLPFNQLIENLYSTASGMTTSMFECAERYYAPINPDFEYTSEVSSGEHHLVELNEKLRDFHKLMTIAKSAAYTFYKTATSPDSAAASVSTSLDEIWEADYPRKTGTLQSAYHNYGPWMPEKGGTDTTDVRMNDHCDLLVVNSDEDQHEDKLCPFKLTDHNIKAYSYYWAKKNMHKYIAVINHLGIQVDPLFDQHPSEWDYTQIAAPLFLQEKDGK
jgi:hypothetical protein